MVSETTTRRATLASAQAMLMFFNFTFGDRGWMPALYGSTLEVGEGRDIDLFLVQLPDSDCDQEEIAEWLVSLGLDVVMDEARGSNLRCLAGTFRGYVLDITLVAATT